MSMFGNKPTKEVDVRETPTRAPERAPERPMSEPLDQKTSSVFARGARMNGTLRCEGSVRIDGEFDGNLETGDVLVIGKEGIVRANVKVKRAIIGGRLEGNIHASGKVELQSGCEVMGEVETPSLVIEEGVVFEGTCKMGAKSPSRSGAPSAPRPASAPTPASASSSSAPSTSTSASPSLAQKL